ncbi:MAG: ABC transporter ATP-binding protein [Acidimicrobiales bacterium]
MSFEAAPALDGSIPAVACRGLRKAFGGHRVLEGTTFEVPAGSITALIGPNGAGKSTAVNLLAGALSLDGGSVHVLGTDVTGRPAHKVAAAGLIRTFQLSREFGRLTVTENLMVTQRPQLGESLWNVCFKPGAIRRQERQHLEYALSVLDSYDLYELRDSEARSLSGGQKRLLELARAVVAEPKVLVLDEPMAGINPVLVDRIGEHIKEVRQSGVTVLMIEHNLNVVEQICDRVIVMAEGQTLAVGSMAEMRENPEVVRAYLGGALSARA